ncbi:ATPase family AAA domain-containing protein 5 isoform X2 [Narcine bancroftii]|uniref:ATPase family AAA domain-containing protein 5 isoform X2 n=1 Tax=Narcine bancroftii TaxID=1343680 RepID=UPI003831A744
MVGILAMAGTVEDYDQPCKKQRKDVEDPATNTITSYFSPVFKLGDTTSQSPKSSNILDYFRKTQSGQHVASQTSVEWEEKNSSGISVVELTAPSEGKYQTPKRKRPSKRVNLSKRLSASKCNEVVEISDTSNSSIPEVCSVRSGVGVLGSDTAALIAQLCAEGQELFEDDKKDVSIYLGTTAQRKTATEDRKESCKESSRNIKKSQKQRLGRKEVDCSRQSDVENVAMGDCCESRDEGSVASQFVVHEDEGTGLSETNTELTAEETSSLNNSTVTVSFEEFMKNQDGQEALAEKACIQECSESNSLVESTNVIDPQPLSPKTVTVHAQIHPNPVTTLPHFSKVKQQKIASIFLRKKPGPEDEVVEIQAISPHSADCSDSAPPRRSNVVIAEEELELSVLDLTERSPVKPKCGHAVKEQFMNAFKQPLSAELAKNGIKKMVQNPRSLKDRLTPSEAAEDGSDQPSQEKEKEKSVHFLSQGSKDSRVKVKHFGSTTMKKKKSLQDVGKARCKNVVCREGKQADPNVETSIKYIAESKHLRHPATTPSNKTCRITRQSLRQQRDASIYCLTSSKSITVGYLSTPVHASTPKQTYRSSKGNGIYKAEMLPATSQRSPIRMKFTRLPQSKNADKAREMDDNLDFTPKSNQICRSKNLAKAKKLIEKAKGQNKCRNCVETIAPLRRSARQQAKFDGKSHRTKNFAVNLSSDTENNLLCKVVNKKEPKELKILSDEFGKNSSRTSAAKNTRVDVKVASIFLAKKVVKTLPLEPITILDESGCKKSENSQDVEQFRAKRQFLMSGLPDTLKKHMAKAATAMEIYSSGDVSFQAVVHVQQKNQESLLWNLPWPSCAILNQLRNVRGRMDGILKATLSLGDFSEVKCTTTPMASWIGLSNRSTAFSQDVQKCLLEEIKASNPDFPAHKLFKSLLQKRKEHFADMLRTGSCNKIENSCIELDTGPQEVCSVYTSPEPLLGKRKRKIERQGQKQKKKSLDSKQELIIIQDEENCTLEMSTRSEDSKNIQSQNCSASTRNWLRSIKRKQQDSESKIKVAEAQPIPAPSCISELTDQPKRKEAATFDGLVMEDLLWTEKYQPQHSSELVGNLSAVRKLHVWLMEWKKRADKEETRNQKERKTEKDKNVDAWENSDFDLESSGDEDFLCNTVLITGPPGVGKTAAVYACAQELGFKVFEVNASSPRSGRQILSQLKEATQSHQVDKQGAGAFKPAFFSGTKSLPVQTAKSPKKANSPRSVVSSPRKIPLSPRRRVSKKSLAPTFLANFIKAPLKTSKSEEPEKTDHQINVQPQKISRAQRNNPRVLEACKTPSLFGNKDTEECDRKRATSLILFEEVDVIFDDDAGFLNAVKTFMATAKRPVILTTTDPSFSLMFECCFEEICFKVPSPVNIATYLQLLCLAENLRTDGRDLAMLLALNKCDIRQSMLYLQFWVRSGGGHKVDMFLPADGMGRVPIVPEEEPVKTTAAAEDAVEGLSKGSSIVKVQDIPKCNTGCAENLLGIKNSAEPSKGFFSMFKNNVTLEQWQSQVQILLEFQRRQLDFVFSSLEFLLPPPLRLIPDPEKVLGPTFHNSKQKDGDSSAKSSPVKTSGRIKRCRRAIMFDDSDLFDKELNNSNELVTLPNGTSTSTSVAEKSPGSQEIDSSIAIEKQPRSSTEKECLELTSSYLSSIAEFSDSLSFLDSCFNRRGHESEGSCGQGSYHWATAKIKNGMLDEKRLDPRDWWSFPGFGETRAAVELLSWNKCRSRIQQAMDLSGTKCTETGKEVVEELVLRVPNHQNNNTLFTDLLHYLDSTASKRTDVLKTVFSNSKMLVSLGNRRASALDYLPALRTICRAEKLKEQGKAKRRFLHYLDGVHLELPKKTLEALAADFP